MDRPFEINCDCFSSAPVEMFSIEKQKSRLILSSTTDLTDIVRRVSHEVNHWLPIAAEMLNISANLKDYILTPVISMPSDLPNRNKHAFPTEELTAWSPDNGMVAYRTWQGMGCFVEHNNKDYTIARGIILDCMLKPLNKTDGSILKLVKLAAWDRTRDPILANNILYNNQRSYSMGAKAADLSCSICGSRASRGDCGHITPTGPFQVIEGKLAHWNAHSIKGIELSHVASPAYFSAVDNPVFSW